MKIAKGHSLPKTYLSAVLTETGKPLSIETKQTSVLSKGEVWVRMKAAPINPSDLSMVAGTYPHQKTYPYVPGLEGSGMVVATGGGFLANRLLGKRVACSAPETSDGTWAEFMKVDAKRCIPLHKNVDFAQGASSLVNPLTALVLLQFAKNRGHSFVNTAAAGALGKMMIKLAKIKGIKTINLVRKNAHIEPLKAIGADAVLNSTATDFPKLYAQTCADLKPATILDAVGGSFSNDILSPTPIGCQLIAYASLSSEPITVQPQPIIRDKKTIVGFHLGSWMAEQSILTKMRLTSQAQNLIADGIFQTEVHRTVQLKELNDAIKSYQTNMSAGKWLLNV